MVRVSRRRSGAPLHLAGLLGLVATLAAGNAFAQKNESTPSEEAASSEEETNSEERGDSEDSAASEHAADSEEVSDSASTANAATSGESEEAAQPDEGPIPPPPPSSDEDGEGPLALVQGVGRKGQQYKRWTEVGPFVGMVRRPSKSSEITYQTGVAYGGFFRPQLTPWLGVRLFYREERIPVTVAPGAFDMDGQTLNFAFEQPDLKVTSLGGYIEPSWNFHSRLRLTGTLGWSWVRIVADMPEAPGFDLRASRAGVEMNWTLGAGLSFDVVPNWFDITMAMNQSFITGRSGDIYKPIQAVVDGEITHLGPLPEFKYATDLIFYFGLIL